MKSVFRWMTVVVKRTCISLNWLIQFVTSFFTGKTVFPPSRGLNLKREINICHMREFVLQCCFRDQNSLSVVVCTDIINFYLLTTFCCCWAIDWLIYWWWLIYLLNDSPNKYLFEFSMLPICFVESPIFWWTTRMCRWIKWRADGLNDWLFDLLIDWLILYACLRSCYEGFPIAPANYNEWQLSMLEVIHATQSSRIRPPPTQPLSSAKRKEKEALHRQVVIFVRQLSFLFCVTCCALGVKRTLSLSLRFSKTSVIWVMLISPVVAVQWLTIGIEKTKSQ